MLGAAFAGGLVAVVGPANALVVDAVSFLLSAAVLAWSTTSLGKVPARSADAETDVEADGLGTSPSCARAGTSCAATRCSSASP